MRKTVGENINKNTQYHVFVAEIMKTMLPVAEYASEHDGLLEGEALFWHDDGKYGARDAHESTLAYWRKELRHQLTTEWLCPDYPDAAPQLMEMADMSETTIEAYRRDMLARISGRKRTLKQEVFVERERKRGRRQPKYGYWGVYPQGKKTWVAKIGNAHRGIWLNCGTYHSKEEAARARDAAVIKNGYVWAELNFPEEA